MVNDLGGPSFTRLGDTVGPFSRRYVTEEATMHLTCLFTLFGIDAKC